MRRGPVGRGCAPRLPGPAARGAPCGATAATGGAARLAAAISLLSPMDAPQPAMSGCQRPAAAMKRTEGIKAVLESTPSEHGGQTAAKLGGWGAPVQLAECH
ncbi:hypothetical protein PAHAL_7G206000 [Panicum hallii]|uniref:Uncharacterized protein n=1 Tax=Panicum hallii TaxID=206008 RepID=A0A2T8ICY6_9POAL|nr:hypothetical protein PAHAL_7G206000 [Panicum hallii]